MPVHLNKFMAYSIVILISSAFTGSILHVFIGDIAIKVILPVPIIIISIMGYFLIKNEVESYVFSKKDIEQSIK
jgi:hypothetical protein